MNDKHLKDNIPYQLGTGVPRALNAWPKIDLVDQREVNQFKAIVWRTVMDSDPVSDPVNDPVNNPVNDPVEQLLCLLLEDALSPSAIMLALGLKHRHSFKTNYLRPALAKEWIEMTLPDKPNSRLQRYRLTLVGREQAIKIQKRKKSL